MVATRGAIASALMVLDGGLRMALRKEGEGGKGMEKGGSKGGEGKSASLPLDRLNSSKFIEPPSDGDDISDYVQLFRSVTFGQREGDNQRACFELSRARRRFLHPDRSLRRLMNGAAVWLVTFRRDTWFCRGSSSSLKVIE